MHHRFLHFNSSGCFLNRWLGGTSDTNQQVWGACHRQPRRQRWRVCCRIWGTVYAKFYSYTPVDNNHDYCLDQVFHDYNGPSSFWELQLVPKRVAIFVRIDRFVITFSTINDKKRAQLLCFNILKDTSCQKIWFWVRGVQSQNILKHCPKVDFEISHILQSTVLFLELAWTIQHKTGVFM